MGDTGVETMAHKVSSPKFDRGFSGLWGNLHGIKGSL